MIRTCWDFEGKVEVLPFPADVMKELKRFAGIQEWGYISEGAHQCLIAG